MHYYQFNISDYRSATVHLSNDEDLAYRRLMDMYYDTESKIPLDTQWVARRLRLDTQTIEAVLNDMFVKHEDGYFNARCQDVIAQYHAMAEKNRANGRLGGRKKNPTANPLGSQSQPIVKATINQELETINQDKKNKRGLRLASNFCLTKEWEDFCVEQRPELNAKKTFDQFKDYWVSQAGQKGVKLDWFATWRNWVRNTNAPKVNPADIARVTVPMNNQPDAALEKIKEDAKRAAPIPLEVLAKMAALRAKA
jgi:uncharacterized protein YdaU (DUF1376 family)